MNIEMHATSSDFEKLFPGTTQKMEDDVSVTLVLLPGVYIDAPEDCGLMAWNITPAEIALVSDDSDIPWTATINRGAIAAIVARPVE